jgi:HK97 family phage major capsid protein/HK97 family phage prohead protease
MPDPSKYDNQDDWMQACMHARHEEHPSEDNEQSVAICMQMWRDKALPSADRAWSTLTVKSVNTEQRTIEGIASTPSVDRVGDILEPLGAKFTVPMPLLWQHKQDQPVGHVTAAKATRDGISITAKLARIEEPGELKNTIDKAWQAVKAGLVRGLSVGFRGVDIEPIDAKDPWGGLRYKVWNLFELSLVTVPANADATISVVKTADQAALGHTTDRPGATGKAKSKTISLKLKERTMSKTIAEQLEALSAKRAANEAQMANIMQKAADEGRVSDDAERETFDNLQSEVEQLDGDIRRFQVLEHSNQTKAQPVAVARSVDGGTAVQVRGPIKMMAPQLPPGIRFARVAKCLGLAQGNRAAAAQIAEQMYPDDQGIINVSKAAVQAGNTYADRWANNLVGDEGTVYADFLEFLRPMTILGKFGTNGIPDLKRVPFRTPLITQVQGGTGYWVGEGQAKPLTQFAFDRTTLTPLKVANIAVVTEEVLRDSSPNAEAILRDSLAQALVERIDTDFTLTTKTAVAQVSPASITNGITPIASGGNDEANTRKDVLKLLSAFAAANNPPTTGVWIMSAHTALGLQLMINPLGQQSFTGVTMNGGSFFGMPVIVSEYIQVSGSPTARIVILLNARDLWFADDGGIAVDMSREASLQMDNAPTMTSAALGSPQTPVGTSVVSLWQTNSVGFRAERTLNWKLARPSGVKILSGVNWGT